MRKKIIIGLISVLLLAAPSGIVKGESVPGSLMDALCLPGVDPMEQIGCGEDGPSAVITEFNRLGITFPPLPLPVRHTDATLAEIPYFYAKLNEDKTPAFNFLPNSFEDNPTRYIDAGFKYISYLSVNDTDRGKFFLSRNGDWIDGSYIARASIPVFHGVEVTGNIRYGFGWIIDPIQSRIAAGYDQAVSGKNYQRFNFVNVYETITVKDTDWTRIGPNEWIEKRKVARVLPDPTPPEGVTNGRWIAINLYDQTLAVYENSTMIFATLISTGIDPYFTQPGVFQIYDMKEKDTMSGAFAADRSDYYYLEDVPFTMYYDQARAIHGAYWHSIFGYERSHGCVNLSVADAHWVYNWAEVGDWVYVWDSSGRTPTDPAYYTQGGA